MSSRSAVTLILGVSISALAIGFAACDGGTSDTGGGAGGPTIIVAGGGNVAGSPGSAGAPAGAGAPGSAGASVGGGGAPAAGGTPGGAGDAPAGVPLSPMDGWVDGMSNSLMIQGAMFAYADTESLKTQVGDFTGTNACIKGTAAKVDLMCTPVAPATDCYGQFWGAAIGLNLNQAIDPITMMGTDAAPYNASAIKGFTFTVTGTTIPAPTAFRFKVEGPVGTEYCNVPTKKVVAGVNTFLFTDLVQACYKISTAPPNPVSTMAQPNLVKIAWQVVTNTSSAVPYDFCITDVRALQ